MLKNDPAYKIIFEEGKYRFFVPENTMSYHTSRYLQVGVQQIYSNAGATKEVLEEVMNQIIERCNAQKDIATLRTDVASFANTIKYRLKYPVDQHCAIRMGAILCFLEYEDAEGTTITEEPNKYDDFWTKKKIDLAMNSPEIYSFFLTLGVSRTQAYSEHLDTSTTDYFIQRDQMIQSLLPTNP